ncbi:MAG: phosphate/phosphite/phosphonate ABC transporter substrate-binding protein [Deltaproteobacteria bacterium]|nr:phosphate/phosphite/phosphonate ABC transporter substrate-binding protein [Deltaproteobacteria bacterium]
MAFSFFLTGCDQESSDAPISLYLVFFFFFPGCNQERSDAPTSEQIIHLDQLQPLPALLEQPEGDSLKVAVASILSPQGTVQSYQPFLHYLENRIEKDVILIQKKTYQEVNDLLSRNVVDVAFVCTGAYVSNKKIMDLLVVPQINGKTTYNSLLIVPANSDVRKIEELKGSIFAFTDPLSNTGYRYPVSLLEKRGEKPETFFSRTILTYSHDRSIVAVADGLADGASVDSIVFDFFQKRDPEIVDRTRVIHQSEPFAMPPVVVPAQIDKSKKDWLKDIFLNVHNDPKGIKALKNMGVDRFVEPMPERYRFE